MKKFLVSILTAAFILAGCAGLAVKDPCADLGADYYVTSPAGETEKFCPETDYAVVRNVREKNADEGLTVGVMWIDYSSNAVVLQYDLPEEDSICAVFMFAPVDFPIVLTEDYESVRPQIAQGIPCEKLHEVLAQELNKE